MSARSTACGLVVSSCLLLLPLLLGQRGPGEPGQEPPMGLPSTSETSERGKGPGTPAPIRRSPPVGIGRPSTLKQREIDLSPIEQEIVEVIDGIDINAQPCCWLNGRRPQIEPFLQLESTEVARQLLGHGLSSPPRAIDVRDDGRQIATVYEKGEAALWSASTGELLWDLGISSPPDPRWETFSSGADSIRFIEERGWLAISSSGDPLTLFCDLEAAPHRLPRKCTGSLYGFLHGHAFLESGKHVFLATTSNDSGVLGVFVEDATGNMSKRAAVSLGRHISDVAVHSGRGLVAAISRSEGNEVTVFGLPDLDLLQRIELPMVAGHLHFSKEGDLLYTTSYDDIVRAHEVESGRLIWAANTSSKPAWPYAWFGLPITLSPDGEYLAAALRQSEVLIIQASSGEIVERKALRREERAPVQLVWTRDGRHLIVLSESVQVLRVD